MSSGSGSTSLVPSVTSATSAWPKYPPGGMTVSASCVGGHEVHRVARGQRSGAVAGDLIPVQGRGDVPVEHEARRIGGGAHGRGPDESRVPGAARAASGEGAEELDRDLRCGAGARLLVVGGRFDVQH